MLVDLGRNDLGRVCEYGTVAVETFMAIETYSHVMHIVSSVTGTLREGDRRDGRAALGAPGRDALRRAEGPRDADHRRARAVKRGGYGGAIGYLSFTGDLDTCIHIRTVVLKDGVAHIQAGGGTVADARPDYEYEESVNKARARQAGDRAGGAAGGLVVSVKVLVIDNYDSFTYNLVQYLGELGAELEVVRNDRASVDELLATQPDRVVVSPGPVHAGRGRDLAGGRAPLPRGRGADARRLPRAPVDGAGLRRRGDPPRAGARQDDDDRARRRRRSSPGCRARSPSAATTR